MVRLTRHAQKTCLASGIDIATVVAVAESPDLTYPNVRNIGQTIVIGQRLALIMADSLVITVRRYVPTPEHKRQIIRSKYGVSVS